SSKLQTIEVEFDSNIDQKQLLSIHGVQQADKHTGSNWILQANTTEDIRPLIFEFAVSNKLKVLSMQKSEQSLEKVFQRLTRKKRGN
ncbi:MAG: gliding motility-associated ABC transporter ATP-binding subunit GldA, partial [Bacteroidetes bacterium]